MAKPATIVVDESISTAQWEEFERFARKRGLLAARVLFVRDAHPGMPDAAILEHLLNKTTLFLTTDRPLHNTGLAKGPRGYYVSPEGRFTSKPLRGITPKDPRNLTPTPLKDSYHAPKTAIRPGSFANDVFDTASPLPAWFRRSGTVSHIRHNRVPPL